MAQIPLTLDVQQMVLDYIRSLLAIDTGNLRFNGTTLTGSTYEFEINVGGALADYFKHLETNPNSVYYRDFEDIIAPGVRDLLESALNGRDLSEYDFSVLSNTLNQQEYQMDIAKRNEVFYASLERNT